MNLKNNLKHYFPLKVAIYSVLGFFTIYILFGLDGWGDRASNENAIGEVSRSVSYTHLTLPTNA